jgi:hypothetical protein
VKSAAPAAMSSAGRCDSRGQAASPLTVPPRCPVDCAAAEVAAAVGSGGAAPVGSGGSAGSGPGPKAAAAEGVAATAATPPTGTGWSEPVRGAFVPASERWKRGFSCLDSTCPSALLLGAFQVASSTMAPVAPSRTCTTASWLAPLSRVVTRTTASSFIPSASAWYAPSVPSVCPYFWASS